jgi:putative nucleotidyltransferase with HDIG domain
MKTRKISLSQAVPGMVAASELYSVDGLLIMNKDTTLTDKIITRLEFYSVTELHIYIITSYKDASVILESEIYYEKLRESESFKTFQKAYQQAIVGIKNSFDDNINNNHAIDSDHLLSDIGKVICQSSSNMEIFNMMQCIHNFDDNTYVHSLNVALICNIIGKWLHFVPEDLETITLCGLLHDIGKLLVPSEIILKPSKLTKEEYSTIQTHSLLGYDLLKNQELDARIKNVALLHHERCDGSGYPYGYQGDSIDSYTKLVSIADVYDAMSSPRVYRGPLCPFEVISIFEAEGYKKYDPKYLLTFMQGIADAYIKSKVRLSNDMVGEVVLTNYSELSRPVVKVNDQFVDLSKERNINIIALA